MDSSGFGVVGLWDPGGLGFWGPLPCASPPEVRTAMALPTPRVSGCRSPAGLWDIFLPGKNREKREIRANPKAGRAEGRLCPLGWRCQRRVAPLGEGQGQGHGDTGTAPLAPPGHSRPGGAGGAPYWGQFVLFTGASLYSLLVPVCPYRFQSVSTGPSLFSLWELLCSPYWCRSCVLTGASLYSLLGPVCPHWSQSLFPAGAALSSLLVPVRPY